VALSNIPELVNIVPNPSIETAITGWARSNTTVVAAAPTRVTTEQRIGLAALRMEIGAATAGATGSIIPSTFIAPPAQAPPFVADDMWLLSVWIRKTNAARVVKLRLLWQNVLGSGGTTLQTDEVISANVTTWQRLQILAIVPTGALSVQPQINATADGVTTGDVYIDGWVMYKSTAWAGYVDGAQGVGYEWLGAAHTTASRRVAQSIQTAIGRSGIVRVSQRVLLTDRNGVPQEDITDQLVEATVDLDVDRSISSFAIQGELRTAGVIKPYIDYILPSLILENADGTVVDEPLGFYTTLPSGKVSNYIKTKESFTGRDLTHRLSTSTFATPFTIATNDNVIATVIEILESEGFTAADYNITPSTRYAIRSYTWGYDEVWSKLRIINQLFDAIGYYKLHTSRYRILQSFPYFDLKNIEPAKRFTTGAGGEVINEVVQKPDYDSIVNMVRVQNDRSGATPIAAVIQNNNLDSPVSIPNLGVTIFRDIKDVNIPDLNAAIAIARQTLQRGATFYNRVTIETLADPTRNPYDIYTFNLLQANSESVLSGKWRCSGWQLGFTPGTARMTQHMGRVEPYE
jgi:hypothetical protein